ncbi:MAG TPA: hypothetical protein VNN09_05110 [Candidatus Competibacteraceae bacterium]|nr:hypothetical protein [Candidatus Competibacteraceae bacterium]
MNQDSALIRLTLLDTFESLLRALDAFCAAVRADAAYPIWVARGDDELAAGLDMRQKALQLYSALWYEDGQDGRDTLTCPGIVGGSPATLAAADACNAAKDAFKQAVLALKGLHKNQADELLQELHRRNQEVALSMRRMGAARLNLKQAYRHIPLLPRKPLKVGFTWSKQGRTIQRISVDEARHLLERRSPTAQTQSDLLRLAEIPRDEMLVRVRSVCPHLRANVVFRERDALQRKLIQAPLPILVPLRPGEPLPDYVPISSEPSGHQRLQRSDVRIEETPFLPTIRVHRYRLPYRFA